MNNNKKSQLIVVTNEKNDKNSKSYLKKIKKIWKEEYIDEIDILETKEPINDQKEFEKFIKHNRGSILCLYPTSLYIPPKQQHRNAEKNQVAQVLANMVSRLNPNKKILVIGSGNVATKLESILDDNKQIVMRVRYRNLDFLSNSFLNQFDILINCARHDSEVQLFYSGVVFDCAGTFKAVDDYEYNQDIRVEYIERPVPLITTRGEIGSQTTRMMLEEVTTNGY